MVFFQRSEGQWKQASEIFFTDLSRRNKPTNGKATAHRLADDTSVLRTPQNHRSLLDPHNAESRRLCYEGDTNSKPKHILEDNRLNLTLMHGWNSRKQHGEALDKYQSQKCARFQFWLYVAILDQKYRALYKVKRRMWSISISVIIEIPVITNVQIR